MKKMVAFVLCLVMMFSCCFAEEILNKDNSPELASILGAEKSNRIAALNFARNNIGATIEFDGFIASAIGEGSYELFVYTGVWENCLERDIHFKITGKTEKDLGDIIQRRTDYRTSIGDTYYGLDSYLDGVLDETPEYKLGLLLEGINVHVIGTITDYDSSFNVIELDPISIHLPAIEEIKDNDDVVEEINNSDDATEETEVEAPASDDAEYVTLEKGSEGDEVKALQQRLIDLLYLDDVADGKFGNKTRIAVEEFQKEVELEVTGIADPETQTKLFAEDAPVSSPNIHCSSVVFGSMAQTAWSIGGQEFTLKNKQTKTLKTRWGTYKFDAYGNCEKLD